MAGPTYIYCMKPGCFLLLPSTSSPDTPLLHTARSFNTSATCDEGLHGCGEHAGVFARAAARGAQHRTRADYGALTCVAEWQGTRLTCVTGARLRLILMLGPPPAGLPSRGAHVARRGSAVPPASHSRATSQSTVTAGEFVVRVVLGRAGGAQTWSWPAYTSTPRRCSPSPRAGTADAGPGADG